ncbi:unnamed protein product [Cylicocyclus nassatus]|uniref:Uncharacterized protein n=1 Tax=Cylicocyclus nassatus TaxID=53992 RepID=A0AA36DLT1_CYLNA|nr:unnamed protein product [Cylicocyclus nassatus]
MERHSDHHHCQRGRSITTDLYVRPQWNYPAYTEDNTANNLHNHQNGLSNYHVYHQNDILVDQERMRKKITRETPITQGCDDIPQEADDIPVLQHSAAEYTEFANAFHFLNIIHLIKVSSVSKQEVPLLAEVLY